MTVNNCIIDMHLNRIVYDASSLAYIHFWNEHKCYFIITLLQSDICTIICNIVGGRQLACYFASWTNSTLSRKSDRFVDTHVCHLPHCTGKLEYRRETVYRICLHLSRVFFLIFHVAKIGSHFMRQTYNISGSSVGDI